MASDSLDYWVSSSVCSPVLFDDDGLEDGALDYWVSASICSPEPAAAAGGGVTGTAALAGAGANLAAVGTVGAAGTTDLSGPGASLAAVGAVGVAATGVLPGADASLAADGQVAVAGTAALAGPGASLAAVGTVGILATGVLPGADAGLAANGQLIVAGAAALAGPGASLAAVGTVGIEVITGTASLAGAGASLAASGGAFALDATFADALRLYASPGVEILHLRAVGTIPGVRVILAAARNGPGVGMLRYSAGSLYWRAPGSATWGEAVPAALDGEYLVTDGDDDDKFLRLQVYADYLQERDGRVFLADRYNNAIGGVDVTAAEALAGDVATWGIIARNERDATLQHVSAWLDLETQDLELSANGVDWSGGVSLGDLAPAAEATLHIRRTIGAAAECDPAVLNYIHFSFNMSG